jgi:hypothetical protein
MGPLALYTCTHAFLKRPAAGASANTERDIPIIIYMSRTEKTGEANIKKEVVCGGGRGQGEGARNKEKRARRGRGREG